MTPSDLTPTEYLIMEVLAARYRTGEHMWTFPSRFARKAEQLASRGLVYWKYGIAEGTILIWFTNEGKLMWIPERTATNNQTDPADPIWNVLKKLESELGPVYGTLLKEAKKLFR